MADRSTQPLMILVVDDDDLNQKMINILLSSRGCVVKAALNGQEALDAVRSQEFDLVFMDLQLPDMNGLEVSRRIREREAGKNHLPIVALTANDIPGEALEWLQAGMDDFIYKPYNLGQLSRMITLYVDGADAFSASVNDSGAEPSGRTGAVLDPELALLNFSNDSQVYKDFLENFIFSLPENLELMNKYQSTGNLKELAVKAHNLKGVSASLGAMRLSRLANQLEHHCRDGQKTPAETSLKEIQESLPDLRSRVNDFLKS